MSITRGEFLRSLGKSLPGLVASTGVATAAETLFRLAHATPPVPSPAAKQAREQVPFLSRGPADSRLVAFTFDDGPVPGVTERILDTLRAHDARATFFLIGEKVAAAPELARRVLAEGHELGHHTYTHRKLTELSDPDFDRELDRTQALFHDLLGRGAGWFRPPFGALRQDQARRVRERAMKVALWSVDAEDWRDPSPDSIVERIGTHLHPGAIVLCHDVAATADGLDRTLRHMREAAAYQLRTLTDLMEAPLPT
jgi:peptidoglycan/xylan/chitin deacetylase (PgdA/CDA1 family)